MDMSSANVVNISDAHHARTQRGQAAAAGCQDSVRIDGWLVEPALNRLTRHETTVRLRPQLVDVLLCLASRPGKVFSSKELVAQVWEGRWVASSAVSRCIAELRTALDDDAHRPHIIETITKRGYRLIAPVVPVPVAPNASVAPALDAASIVPQGVPIAAGLSAQAPGAAPRVLWQWFGRVARRLTATG